MAKIITDLLNKRRSRTSADSEDSISSPEHKETRTTKQLSEEEDEVWTALNMSDTVAGKLEEILKKLQKLHVIEASVKNIEVKLKNLEDRTNVVEKDIKARIKRRTSREPNRMLMRLNKEEQRVFLICIRFGSCEVRRLSRA